MPQSSGAVPLACREHLDIPDAPCVSTHCSARALSCVRLVRVLDSGSPQETRRCARTLRQDGQAQSPSGNEHAAADRRVAGESHLQRKNPSPGRPAHTPAVLHTEGETLHASAPVVCARAAHLRFVSPQRVAPRLLFAASAKARALALCRALSTCGACVVLLLLLRDAAALSAPKPSAMRTDRQTQAKGGIRNGSRPGEQPHMGKTCHQNNKGAKTQAFLRQAKRPKRRTASGNLSALTRHSQASTSPHRRTLVPPRRCQRPPPGDGSRLFAASSRLVLLVLLVVLLRRGRRHSRRQ